MSESRRIVASLAVGAVVLLGSLFSDSLRVHVVKFPAITQDMTVCSASVARTGAVTLHTCAPVRWQ